MRALLAWLSCWLLAVQSAFAQVPCAIEISSGSTGPSNSGGTVVAYNPGTSSNITTPLTTTQANEPIFVLFFANSQQTSGPAPTVTSISPLSFTRRAVAGGLTANCYGGFIPPALPPTTCYMAMEVWEALSPSPLTAQNFTVTANIPSGGGAGTVISAFGVTNVFTPLTPFDSNGSLPAVNQQINLASVPPFVSGVSTNNSNDLILAFCGSVDDISLTSCTTQAPSAGWSGPTAGNGFLSSFINFTYRSAVWYETVSSRLSSATLVPQTPVSKNWVLIGDAIVCGPNGPPPGGAALPHIWVHE